MSESKVRAEMVRTCRAMNDRGLNPGLAGNLSVRVDSGMLITPSAVPYHRLDPERIVRMRLDGSDVQGPMPPSTEWRLHAAILSARPDVDTVLHAHPMFCTTLACLRREIPSFHYMVAVAGGNTIRCATYATVGTFELAEHAVRALEGRRACLLANHGMVALGPSPGAALELALEVETIATQYWRTLQVGAPALLSDAEMEEVHARFRDYRPRQAAPSKPPSPTVTADAGLDVREAGPVAAPSAPSEALRPPLVRRIDWADLGQRWIGRVGGLLLLVGLAYLMKFAVDRGWFGPPLRIGFGAATGLVLLAVGLRMEDSKRPYALTLLGTGLATLYLTGYAAYALYSYLGSRTAFIALAATTALALLLARRREEQILAQVGAAGAFATPLLLGEAGGGTALSLYITAVTGWTATLAFRHGWRFLFVTTLIGAFGLLAMGAARWRDQEALPLSLAAAFAWGAVAFLPLLRERVAAHSGRVRPPVPQPLRGVFHDPLDLDHATVAFLVPFATLLLVALQGSLWDLERAGAAAIGFAAAGVLALTSAGAGDDAERARRVGVAPILLVYLGSVLLVPDDAARVALLAAGGTLALVLPALRDAYGGALLGHVLFGLIASWLGAQLTDTRRPPGFANTLALAELAAIAAAAFVALRHLDPAARRIYLTAAHLAVLGWVLVCARGIDAGLAWISVLWGIYGAALLVLAVSYDLARLRLAALATLALVAAKLLLVDTAGVGAGWRIILFLGFGAAFLGLGYISSPEARR